MADIIGITAIVNDKLRSEILRLWNIAETKYNSKGVQSFNHPNLSFQGGLCDDIPSLMNAISNLCANLGPFQITVDGLGFFEQPSNVVYLKVIKSEELKSVHRKVNDLLNKHCSDIFEFYTPENWIPHITVAMDDLSIENLQRFKRDFVGYTPLFTQIISNLQLIQFYDNGHIELVENFICKR